MRRILPWFRKPPTPLKPPDNRPPAGIDFLVAQANREPPPAPALSWQAMADLADQAHQAADWTQAEARWHAMRSAYPEVFYSYTNGATALSHLGRHTEAQALLAEAAQRFPHERAVPLEAGRIAMANSDWPAAETHWRAALTFDVRPWWVYTELAGALEHQDRLAEAESVLLEAQARSTDPNEITLYTYPARLAWKREQWPTAVDRWAEALHRFPHRQDLPARLHEAMMRLAEHDPIAYETRMRAGESESIHTLALRFESLGGTGPDGGSEFGFFQRTHHVEPLGLFRWATVPVTSLIAALNQRFKGMGEPDAIVIAPHQDQWQITDLEYGTQTHSFVSSIEVQHDAMMRQASRRMRFLAKQLINDLANPRKVFIVKSGSHAVTQAETEALSSAMRSYGPGMLLCVCAAGPEHPEGLIERRAPSVFVGYMDFSAQARHPAWETLCRRMEEIARETAQMPEDQTDWPEALARWQRVRDTFPDRPEGHEGVIRSLRSLGRIPEAAPIMMHAIQRFGDHPGLLMELARLTLLIGWPEQAQLLWADIRAQFPDIAQATIQPSALPTYAPPEKSSS